ncbi:23S rRNA (guanosine(2251)-2'-O)-methyltransferase [Bertholletia excelsa]
MALLRCHHISKPRNFSSGLRLKHAFQIYPPIKGIRSSSLHTQKNVEDSGNLEKTGKSLPWLASYQSNETKTSEKSTNMKTSRSSWEESADNFLKRGKSTIHNRGVSIVENRGNNDRDPKVMEEEEEEVEAIDDPRWDKIKNRFKRIVNVKPQYDRSGFQKWNKQESWGRKTWKEATESSMPKMVGEGIYGVGPVLAALAAGRREFYALYIQEGLDLSNNNRKKKDKKGFEKVLRMAEKIGLSRKEASKHDLNMIVDNRPHQGLVLDASPLEMVGIKELDPIQADGEKAPLWIALDEVTDPQNLGAIIRSAYFFGAAGVVLCAKNSAPLSGVVSKASAGSLELMELRSCKNMMQFLVLSAENGWRVLGGSVSSKAIPLHKVPFGAPTILVLGSEGTGLRPLVERSCTHLVKIPGNIPVDISTGLEDREDAATDHGCSGGEFRSFMAVESLNVSVAAGVLLHHLIGINYDNYQSGDEEADLHAEN